MRGNAGFVEVVPRSSAETFKEIALRMSYTLRLDRMLHAIGELA
jgi:hypothetical protein